MTEQGNRKTYALSPPATLLGFLPLSSDDDWPDDDWPPDDWPPDDWPPDDWPPDD